jgi:hypothetical protein
MNEIDPYTKPYHYRRSGKIKIFSGEAERALIQELKFKWPWISQESTFKGR